MAKRHRDFARTMSVPIAIVAWIYAPLFVAIANGVFTGQATASAEAAFMAWIVPLFIGIAAAEMKAIEHMAA